MPYTYPFPMVSATATMLVIKPGKTNGISLIVDSLILLGRRSMNSDNVKEKAYPGYLSLPGGFLESGKETVEQTAIREVKEETNLDITEEDLRLYHVSSNPKTDPRAHVVNTCFYIELPEHRLENIKAGDDLSELVWMPIVDFLADKELVLAFDHKTLAHKGINAWLKNRF